MPGQIGNKGGGRKGYSYEFNKNRALTGLWKKVADKIEAGEELTEMEEKWVAPLLAKTIKQETDITSGNKPLPIMQITNVQSDDSNK